MKKISERSKEHGISSSGHRFSRNNYNKRLPQKSNKESTARYEALLTELDDLLGEAVDFLSEGKASGVTAINLTSARYKGTVYYKDKWYTADIEPYSSRRLTEYSLPQKSPLSYDDEHIESDLFRLTFNKNGNIKGLVDKRSGRALAGEYLNKLNVYRDKRLFYNAWDISVNYTKKKPAEFKLVSYSVIMSDASVTRENIYTYGKSRLVQKVVLTVGSPIVDLQPRLTGEKRTRCSVRISARRCMRTRLPAIYKWEI